MALTTPKISVLIPIFLLISIVCSLEDKCMMKKETSMVFYLQHWQMGSNVTSVLVAGLNGTDSKPFNFGSIVVLDDAITIGIDRQSKEIGRARGIFAIPALDSSAAHWLFSIVFTDGKYKGSMLQIQGLEIFFTEQRELVERREMSVVSGTGSFRYVTGYVVVESAFIDLPGPNAILKLTVSLRSTEFMTPPSSFEI